jgi:hypothetical protein
MRHLIAMLMLTGCYTQGPEPPAEADAALVEEEACEGVCVPAEHACVPDQTCLVPPGAEGLDRCATAFRCEGLCMWAIDVCVPKCEAP